MTDATMLERAAVAVHNAEIVRGDLLDISDITARNIARAVLMAVREPGMSVWIDAECSDDTHPVDIFTSMIDTILSDGEGR